MTLKVTYIGIFQKCISCRAHVFILTNILDSRFSVVTIVPIHFFWFIHKTDAIFLLLTRAWGGEGYDEAGGLENFIFSSVT